MNAFVTDGDERPALAITRSLGRRGISVFVGAERGASLAGSSRYCTRSIVYPSPASDPDGFERFLLALVERERIDVVVPVADVTTQSVITQQNVLGRRTAVAVPPAAAFEAVTDKAQLFRRAVACGVPVPRTVVVEHGHALERVIHQVAFPAVVKSFRSRIATGTGWVGTSAHYASSASDLTRLYRETAYLASFPSLIQERITGPGVGLFALFDRGRLVSTFAHRRLREKPPSGGVSVLRESVPADPELIDYASRLLSPIGWHGVAMVEFKRDRQSGEPFLIEVNGRFWGSLQLAVDAGVDFPFLACQLACGQHIDTVETYRIGVKSRWLLGDLDHLLLRFFRRERDQNLPDGTPSRGRALIEFMKFTGRDLKYEVLRRDDPRPFLYEAVGYARNASSAIARAARAQTFRQRSPLHPAPIRGPEEERHARAVR